MNNNATFLRFLKNTRNDEILKKNSVFFFPEPNSLKSFFLSNSNEINGAKNRVLNSMVKNKQIQKDIQEFLNASLNGENILERSDIYSIQRKKDPSSLFNDFERKNEK